jgi:ornithine carbamoyltransferase
MHPAHLLRVFDLGVEGLQGLLKLIGDAKHRPKDFHSISPSQTVIGIFELPSTRTRLAFAAAAHRLGVLPFFVRSDELQLDRGEATADTARSLSSLAGVIVARFLSHAMLTDLSAAATVPVINALSDRHHPCEAIASMFTLAEYFGGVGKLQMAYVGDATNVAHSLIEAAALSGSRMAISTPRNHGPDPGIMADVENVTKRTGARILVTEAAQDAVKDAHVVFTDTWNSMSKSGASQDDAIFRPYQVDASLMKRASRDAVFIHCLPARRGREVSAEVLDGAQSLVWRQVENHLFVSQALLWRALTKNGAP